MSALPVVLISIILGALLGCFLIPPLFDRLAAWWLRRRLAQAGKIREGARSIGRLAPLPIVDIKADQIVTGEELSALDEKAPAPRQMATTRMIRR